MTAHGAYTQLAASARRTKDLAKDATGNVTALYAAHRASLNTDRAREYVSPCISLNAVRSTSS